jgi:hypothetical protein
MLRLFFLAANNSLEMTRRVKIDGLAAAGQGMSTSSLIATVNADMLHFRFVSVCSNRMLTSIQDMEQRFALGNRRSVKRRDRS